MWKLSIADDQGQRSTVNLARDEYTIGRAEGNAIRLTERNVSRLHAVIRRVKDGLVLEDLGSENGTFANGVRLAKVQDLAHGDLLQIGDYRLDVIDEDLSTQEQAHRPLFSANSGPGGVLPSRLVVLIGPNQGYEFPLEGERHLIGRGEECDFALDHASVSRVHAEVRRIDPSHFEVLDKGSSNGLRVNSREMPRAVLDNGDVIEVGDVILKFVAEGELFRASPEEGAHFAALSAARVSAPPSENVPRAVGRRVVAALGGAAVAIAITAYFLSSSDGKNGALGRPKGAFQQGGALPAEVESGLARAEALVRDGQLQEACELAKRLVTPSVLSAQHPRLQAIGRVWAEAALARAASTQGAEPRKQLWEDVARTEIVPAALRQEASHLLEQNRDRSISIEDLPVAPSELPSSKDPQAN